MVTGILDQSTDHQSFGRVLGNVGGNPRSFEQFEELILGRSAEIGDVPVMIFKGRESLFDCRRQQIVGVRGRCSIHLRGNAPQHEATTVVRAATTRSLGSSKTLTPMWRSAAARLPSRQSAHNSGTSAIKSAAASKIQLSGMSFRRSSRFFAAGLNGGSTLTPKYLPHARSLWSEPFGIISISCSMACSALRPLMQCRCLHLPKARVPVAAADLGSGLRARVPLVCRIAS